MPFFKPSKDELAEPYAVAVGENAPVAWVASYLAGFAKTLKDDPLQYRSFGPYWWLAKQALLDAGFHGFGAFVDTQVFKDLDYGDIVYNLLAAAVYADIKHDSGDFYENRHECATPDGEFFTYVLEDSDLEVMA